MRSCGPRPVSIDGRVGRWRRVERCCPRWRRRQIPRRRCRRGRWRRQRRYGWIAAVERKFEEGTAESILATFRPLRTVPERLLVRAVIQWVPAARRRRRGELVLLTRH